MGKRSNKERIEKDYYPTPIEAVIPLIPHLPGNFTFSEPCAGDGRLCLHLDELTNSNALLTAAYDIEPKEDWIDVADATTLIVPRNTEFIITNPPWSRDLLHPMILNFCKQRPTWLLFDADWAHTKQATPYLKHCRKIVAIGRVKWFPDSKYTGKDNACWYLFDSDDIGETIFIGR